MIKFVLGVVVVLALIGGAVQFKSTDKDWSLVVDKEVASSSVKTGVVKIYDVISKFVSEFRKMDKNEEVPVPIATPKK